jgi:hypothetical protein
MSEDKNTQEDKVSGLEILYLTAAHNRGEITFKQWLQSSREWAVAMINQYGTDEDKAKMQQTLERIQEREELL